MQIEQPTENIENNTPLIQYVFDRNEEKVRNILTKRPQLLLEKVTFQHRACLHSNSPFEQMLYLSNCNMINMVVEFLSQNFSENSKAEIIKQHNTFVRRLNRYDPNLLLCAYRAHMNANTQKDIKNLWNNVGCQQTRMPYWLRRCLFGKQVLDASKREGAWLKNPYTSTPKWSKNGIIMNADNTAYERISHYEIPRITRVIRLAYKFHRRILEQLLNLHPAVPLVNKQNIDIYCGQLVEWLCNDNVSLQLRSQFLERKNLDGQTFFEVLAARNLRKVCNKLAATGYLTGHNYVLYIQWRFLDRRNTFVKDPTTRNDEMAKIYYAICNLYICCRKRKAVNPMVQDFIRLLQHINTNNKEWYLKFIHNMHSNSVDYDFFRFFSKNGCTVYLSEIISILKRKDCNFDIFKTAATHFTDFLNAVADTYEKQPPDSIVESYTSQQILVRNNVSLHYG